MSKANTCDGLAVAGKNGDVCDATEIQGDATQFGVAVEQIVGVGNERRALATESDVGGTKVRDGRDSGVRCDDAGFTDLQSRRGGPTEVRNRLPLMEDRLAVAADQGDFFCGDVEARAGC